MQQYADIYLLQSLFTCFGCPPHPSSGVLKTVTAASGTGHNIGTATSHQRGQVGTAHVGTGSCTDIMTCTGGCGHSF